MRAAEAEAAADVGPALTWAQVEDDDDMADADAEPAVAETLVPQVCASLSFFVFLKMITDLRQAANSSTQKLAQPASEQSAAWTAPPAPPMSNPAFPPGMLSYPSMQCVCDCMLTTVLGQDEGLKNVMMAWYYAGYYTALYEGQQTAAPENRNS